jgi:hypothetical protein
VAGSKPVLGNYLIFEISSGSGYKKEMKSKNLSFQQLYRRLFNWFS